VILQSLSQERKRFLSSEDYTVILDHESEPGYLLLKVDAHSEPPPSFSVLIGEVLYHLRSSLDHLACALTEENGGIVDDDTEFPIFDDADKFRNPVSGLLTNAIRKRIGDVHATKRAIIEREQPFNRYKGRPHDDPLWLLHDMFNFDKHRSLHVVNAFAEQTDITFDPPTLQSRFILVKASYGTLEGETEIARYRILASPFTTNANVKVNANVPLDVAFSQPGPGAGRPVNQTLGAIGQRVIEVFDALN
jgi:hypothetical protein